MWGVRPRACCWAQTATPAERLRFRQSITKLRMPLVWSSAPAFGSPPPLAPRAASHAFETAVMLEADIARAQWHEPHCGARDHVQNRLWHGLHLFRP